jgi:SPP1 gp7 family putative phage head morphogenesis protein
MQYLPRIQLALKKYAELITPWAEETARNVVNEIDFLDAKAWKKAASQMGVELRAELTLAPTGKVMQEFMREQVRLITSLPLDAGARVHKLTIEGLNNSTRFKSIADEIARTGQVTASRATLIARTETARTAAALTMARAQHIGSDGYIWRTVGDTDVRPRHRKLNGRFFAWDNPPVAGEQGEHAHAGMIYNCRCYPEPVIPEI